MREKSQAPPGPIVDPGGGRLATGRDAPAAFPEACSVSREARAAFLVGVGKKEACGLTRAPRTFHAASAGLPMAGSWCARPSAACVQ